MSTIEMLEDPYEAVTNIMESLVLSFELSRERHRFTLVCNYPFKIPAAKGAVAGFVFDDVHDFAREKGDLPTLSGFEERFDSCSLERPIVIQSIKSTGGDRHRHLDLWFGPNFGGVQFRYGSARAYRRNALAKEVNGESLYRDMLSQEEFDYFDPFPNLMNS